MTAGLAATWLLGCALIAALASTMNCGKRSEGRRWRVRRGQRQLSQEKNPFQRDGSPRSDPLQQKGSQQVTLSVSPYSGKSHEFDGQGRGQNVILTLMVQQCSPWQQWKCAISRDPMSLHLSRYLKSTDFEEKSWSTNKPPQLRRLRMLAGK